jgi:uncharacterized protein YndB with AHSA1/START domain
MNELSMEVWVPKPPQELFRLAFDDGLRLRRWYGAPPGCFRTGGEAASGPGDTYRVTLVDSEGTPFTQEGRVLEMNEGKGMMFEMRWRGGKMDGERTLATLSLHPAQGGTRIEVRQGPFSSPELLEEHRAYWQANLGRLTRVTAGEPVPCFEEFWEESRGFSEPLGIAAYTVLAGLREAGAASEVISQLEETLYAWLPRVPEETAAVLGAVLQARLKDPSV